jgi:hypothetical protein
VSEWGESKMGRGEHLSAASEALGERHFVLSWLDERRVLYSSNLALGWRFMVRPEELEAKTA